MKTLLAALAGVSMLAVCGTASAENYASIGYSKIDLGGADLGAATVRLGRDINSWFGVEGEASIGVQDESVVVPPPGPGAGTYSIELKHSIAAFAVVRAPLGENVTVFGRVGYATSEIEATVPGFTTSGSTDGIAYGVGAQYNFGANAVRADFTRYDVEIDDADTISLSFVRKF